MALTCEKSDVVVDSGESSVKEHASPRGSVGFISNVSRTARIALLAVVALVVADSSAEAKSPKKATAAQSIYFVEDPDKDPQGVFIDGQTIDTGLLDPANPCDKCVIEVRCPNAAVEEDVPFNQQKDKIVLSIQANSVGSVRGQTFTVACEGDKRPGRLFRVPKSLTLTPLVPPAPLLPAFVPAASEKQPPVDGTIKPNYGTLMFDELDVSGTDAKSPAAAAGAPGTPKKQVDTKPAKVEETPHGRWSMQAGPVIRKEFGSALVNPLGVAAEFSREKVFGSFGFGMELGWNGVDQSLATAGGFAPLHPEERLSGHAGRALFELNYPHALNKGGAFSLELEGKAKAGGMFLYVAGRKDAAVDSSGDLANVDTLTTPAAVSELCGGVSVTHRSSGVGLAVEGCGGAVGPVQTKAVGSSEIAPEASVGAAVRVTLP